MSKNRSISLFIIDTFVAIKKIENYTKTFNNAQEFRYSFLHWDATIKELEIIGESIKYILNNSELSKSTPKYFRKIVNFRNLIIHEYFGIDEEEIWDIVKEKLPILYNDLLNISKNCSDINDAIESTIKEYKKYKSKEIVTFLQNLKNKLSI